MPGCRETTRRRGRATDCEACSAFRGRGWGVSLPAMSTNIALVRPVDPVGVLVFNPRLELYAVEQEALPVGLLPAWNRPGGRELVELVRTESKVRASGFEAQPRRRRLKPRSDFAEYLLANTVGD